MTRPLAELATLLIHAEVAETNDPERLAEVIGAVAGSTAFTMLEDGAERPITFREIPAVLEPYIRECDLALSEQVRDAILLSAPDPWGPFKAVGGFTFAIAHEAAGSGLQMISSAIAQLFDTDWLGQHRAGEERRRWVATLTAGSALLNCSPLQAAIEDEWRRACTNRNLGGVGQPVDPRSNGKTEPEGSLHWYEAGMFYLNGERFEINPQPLKVIVALVETKLSSLTTKALRGDRVIEDGTVRSHIKTANEVLGKAFGKAKKSIRGIKLLNDADRPIKCIAGSYRLNIPKYLFSRTPQIINADSTAD